MSVSVDAAYMSLNKKGEELCGDKVEIVRTENSDIVILADGMGSGVKANILATLTSKILATMVSKGAAIEDCVEAIANTLPRQNGVAYATFSVIEIFHSGEAYLAEFDNPAAVFIRDGRLVDYPYTEREIGGKIIREYRTAVKENDCFMVMSDGVTYAGAGEILDLKGWTRDAVADYALKCAKKTRSASRLAAMVVGACNDLYMNRPGDDTTAAVARVVNRNVVNIFTGPPKNKEDDARLMREFMSAEGAKVIAGGTSASIAARYLDCGNETLLETACDGVPPMGKIRGIDLVTEGAITLGKALGLLKRYANDEFDEAFFDELDRDNGASRLAKLIIEGCTDICMFVGTAANEAHDAAELGFELSLRMNLVKQIQNVMEKTGVKVNVKYY